MSGMKSILRIISAVVLSVILTGILCLLGQPEKVSADITNNGYTLKDIGYQYSVEQKDRFGNASLRQCKYEIVSGDNSVETCDIPHDIEDLYRGVAFIGENAFSGYNILNYVKINYNLSDNANGWQPSISVIGKGAFQNCVNLTSVFCIFPVKAYSNGNLIGNKGLSIGENAFKGCINLDDNFGSSSYLIKWAESIGKNAFEGCTKLSQVKFSNNVSIGAYAFKGCSSLTTVKIPSGVVQVGSGAFEDCSSVTTVELSDTMEGINAGLFKNCTSLTSITIPEGITYIGDEAFKNCTELTEITIPSTVTSIGIGAFEGCTNLSTISMSDNITSIGKNAFKKCSKLRIFTSPSKLKTIGDSAFEDCTSLSTVGMHPSVTAFGDYTFKGCVNLSSVVLSVNITKIGNGTFYGCSNLSMITVPSSVTSIGKAAFKDCLRLSSFTIAESLAVIDESAFEGCIGLVSVSISSNSQLVSIGKNAFKDCIGLTGNLLKNCSRLNTIGQYAFEGCEKLQTLSLSETVAEIGKGAFKNCTRLKAVKMPKNLSSVNEDTFYGCEKLTKICISEGISEIHSNAFAGCVALKKIYIPKTLTAIDESAFGSSNSPVYIDTVFYGESQLFRTKYLSINGSDNEEYGNGYLNTKSEWIYEQTESAFESGQAVDFEDDDDDSGNSGGSGNGGDNGSSGGTGDNTGGSENYNTDGNENVFDGGYITFDHTFKDRLGITESLKVVANAPKNTSTGETGSTFRVYTNITPTYSFYYSFGNVKSKLGKVIAGITSTPEKPDLSGSKKITDAIAKNIATATIQNGIITITAKKEPGTVYLHVIDTGDGGAYSRVKIEVVPAPKKIRVYQDDNIVKKLSMDAKGSVKVHVKPVYIAGDKTETEIMDTEIKPVLKGATAQYFKVEASETEPNCFIITNKSLNNGKAVKGKIEFTSPLTGKKASLSITAQ